ncbi:MAG TPA: (5-formylfuran-3-yl)methyl phosphate synthase [Methyloceanibacter sp.]|nr:(5-formylfuran-3-yl)methyl phosphate synthase [Methyloceanibacter sp.]
MTHFLASVRDAEEAQMVLDAGADIVDLKDPAKGALGAVDPATIRSCVAAVAGRVNVSATVGDLPMEPGIVAEAVRTTAACGVDDVKLGVLPDGDPHGCFARLRAERRRAGIILVFFADAMPGFDPIAAALEAGARGVMLDTAGKQSGSLLDHMATGDIGRFVDAGRSQGLIVGVAGALRAADVPPLLVFGPDVIGFRGALCRDGQRGAGLESVACHSIRALIPAETHGSEAEMRGPRAAAMC